MNVRLGNDMFHTSRGDAEALLQRYTVLLELYTELAAVSESIFASLEGGSPPHVFREHLDVKKDVADRIVRESKAIADLKRDILSGGGLADDLRVRVRRCDEELTRMVDHMVEQENRGRDLIMNRGMKISRR
jgi:hypothetical protein